MNFFFFFFFFYCFAGDGTNIKQTHTHTHQKKGHYVERQKQNETNVSSGQEAEEELEEGTVLGLFLFLYFFKNNIERKEMYCMMTTADARIKDTTRNGEGDMDMTENQTNLNSNTSTTTNINMNMNMRENSENDGMNRDMNIDTAEDGQVDISRLSEWTTNDIITYLSSRCAKFGHLYIDICKEKKLTGAMLQQMSEERLQTELNMINPLHRQRMLRDTMDSRRTIEQIQQIHEQFFFYTFFKIDYRFLRLTAADVYAFLLALQGKQLDMDLKDIIVPLMHLQLNGEHFMNLNEPYLREQAKMQMPQIIKVLTLVSWIQSGYDYDSLKQVLKEKDDILKEKEREKEKEKDKDKDKKNKRSSSKTNPSLNDDALDRLEVLTLIEHIWCKERKSPPTEPCYHLLPQHLFDVRKTRGAVVVPKGPNKPVLEWDNNDCLQWLETMKANDKLVRSFRETKVTGKDILNITQWSLENVFGISHKSHIKLIVQGVDKLSAAKKKKKKIRDQLMKDTLLKANHVQEYLNRTPRRPRKKSKDVDASAPRGDSVANNATDNGSRKHKPRKKSVQKPVDQKEDTQVSTQPINLPSTPHQSTAPQQPVTSQPQQLTQQQQQQQQIMQTTQPMQGTPQSTQPTPANSMTTYSNYGYHGYHAPSTQSQYPYYSGPQPYPAMNITPAYGQPNGNVNGTKSELTQIVPLCSCCGKNGEVMRCSQCKQAFYCSRECQVLFCFFFRNKQIYIQYHEICYIMVNHSFDACHNDVETAL
ncbi:hypothetical protein RFI_12907 [Reticulomyxa filosa]|uniref:MYND-type domain-containing protein n=1 Tax=Reticulomyxa filosa TaxID=46433 RepID=X6NFY2_RETFI|nr:hypothetical protein RFI_12907 [Reticulomyxa filosa]|eukprot:ETO24252.1 hypothetical protein RFI_12907 [Reticulomyxa filosa]